MQIVSMSARAGVSDISSRECIGRCLCDNNACRVRNRARLSCNMVSVQLSNQDIQGALQPFMHDLEQYQQKRQRYQRWLPILACLMRDEGILPDEFAFHNKDADDEDRAISQFVATQQSVEDDVSTGASMQWSREHYDSNLHQIVQVIVSRHKFDDLAEVAQALGELHSAVAGMCEIVDISEYQELLKQLQELKNFPLSASRDCMSKVSRVLTMLPQESASVIRGQFPFYLRPLL